MRICLQGVIGLMPFDFGSLMRLGSSSTRSIAFDLVHSLGQVVTMMSLASEFKLRNAMFDDVPKPCDMLCCDTAVICLGYDLLTIVNVI